MYKIVKDDAQIVYIGKEDGSLLSVDRKFFNFLPEVGQEVQVYQNGEDFVILPVEQPAVNPVSEIEKSDKSKVVAGLLGILLGHFAAHSLYLRRKWGGERLASSIVLLLLMVGILSNPYASEGAATFAGLCALVLQGMGLWSFVEGVLILTSKEGSKWHQDGEGRELLD